MKLLHLIHQYPPHHIGGTERYTQGLVQIQREVGHEAAVFVPIPVDLPGKDAKDELRDDHRVAQVFVGQRSPSKVFRDSLAGNQVIEQGLKEAIAQFSPDLIHVQHLMGYPLAGTAEILRSAGLPYVITLHDFWWVCANAQLITNYDQSICDGPNLFLNCGRCVVARSGLPILLPAVPGLALLLARRQRVLRSLLEGASQLIAPTRFVADWYQAQIPSISEPLVIPNGIEPAQLKRDPESDRRHNSEPGPLRILFLGGLSLQKGGHILIEAVRSLGKAVTLIMAGSPSPDPTHDQAILSNLPPNVSYVGIQSKDEVEHILLTSDLLAVPAIWYETFGMVISEAYQMGVPVLASNLGALAERVTHGVDGWLVEPNDVEAWRERIQEIAALRDDGRLNQMQMPPVTTTHKHHEAIMRIYSYLTDK